MDKEEEEMRARFFKLVDDIYDMHQSRSVGFNLDPQVTKNLFAAIIRAYVLNLNSSELESFQWHIPM